MNKKLIVLIMLLPLLLMLSIFTSTQSVALNVKVAVNKIEINGNKVVYLDMDKDEKYLVSYAIYPLAASNREILFTTEAVGLEPLANLEFENGYIIPKSVGTAKVYLTTVDGGYKDSFVVKVSSNKLISIDSTIEKDSLVVGESIAITTSFNPSTYSNKILSYSSSNNSIASVNSKGVIKGEGRGTATITIISDADNTIIDELTVTVYNQDVIDISTSEVYSWNSTGSINLSIASTSNYSLSYKVYDTSYNLLEDLFDSVSTKFVDMGEGRQKFEYTIADNFVGSVIVEFTIDIDGVKVEKECIIHKVNEISCTFDNDNQLYCSVGESIPLHNEFTLTPADANVTYSVTLSNNNMTSTITSDRIRLKGVKPGVTTVTLKVKENLSQQEITLTREIVVKPDDIFINEQFNTYGIENIWTIGKKEVDGKENISKLTSTIGPVSAGDNFNEYFGYTTNNPKVNVLADGTIQILDTNFHEDIEITAKFVYNNIKVESAPFTIRCVGNGVNVRNFADLYSATNDNKVVVLQGDIVDDFGVINGSNYYNENTVTKVTSTYDITHYANLNKIDDAKIKILINFREDVYGNGYVINAHNVAYGLDSADQLKKDALFTGPLNFVSMSQSESSMVSVKGQDNVAFAVYENVTLNNVDLRNCTLKEEDGKYDLTDLTYVGTTVEVFGDNVTITNSRLTNGRTVLRAFGDINDANKVINVNIKSSVLSSSREFLIRMGSNAFVNGTKDNPSPYIDDSDKLSFPRQKDYSSLTDSQKDAYDSKYIKTFINLKNTILKDSGLFSIGIDTHFSGLALADGKGFAGGAVESWKDLAKTSYGAKLTFEGDVRIYDWKDINDVDSSSLIDVYPKSDSDEGGKYESFSFNVKELIQAIANNPDLNTIVYNKGGKQYVHGGIAFFGGGKNYGVVDFKNYNFKTLNGYSVKLSDVNKAELQVAAGNESFYFLLNDSTTTGFRPEDQETFLSSAEAYAPIYKKD